ARPRMAYLPLAWKEEGQARLAQRPAHALGDALRLTDRRAIPVRPHELEDEGAAQARGEARRSRDEVEVDVREVLRLREQRDIDLLDAGDALERRGRPRHQRTQR